MGRPKGSRNVANVERDALVVELFKQGVLTKVIAAQVGITQPDVSAIAKKYGLPPRTKQPPRRVWPSICAVEDCGEERYMTGFCRHHYLRQRSHGDPHGGGPRRTRNPMDRFERYVDKNGPYCEKLGSQCWMWTGENLSHNGYALTYSEALGNTTTAIRWVYGLLVAQVPKDMTLDHLCRIKLCVNPDHLEVVTLVENIQRAPISGVAKIMAAKTQCKSGHDYDTYGVWYTNGSTKTGLRKWARRCTACDPRYLTYPGAVRERAA